MSNGSRPQQKGVVSCLLYKKKKKIVSFFSLSHFTHQPLCFAEKIKRKRKRKANRLSFNTAEPNLRLSELARYVFLFRPLYFFTLPHSCVYWGMPDALKDVLKGIDTLFANRVCGLSEGE